MPAPGVGCVTPRDAVGAGFSYSNTPGDYNTNNNKTADDSYTFLQLWFQQFPAFAANDLWISGESYAGVYVPQLVFRCGRGGGSTICWVAAGSRAAA